MVFFKVRHRRITLAVQMHWPSVNRKRCLYTAGY
jgi:hypothetical protein